MIEETSSLLITTINKFCLHPTTEWTINLFNVEFKLLGCQRRQTLYLLVPRSVSHSASQATCLHKANGHRDNATAFHIHRGNNTISDSCPATPYPYCQLELTTRGAYHCPSIVPSPQPVKGLNNDTDQTCLSTADVVVGLPAQSSPPNSTAMIADS